MVQLSALIALATGVCSVAAAVLPVSKQGKFLYTSDGNRFFIKGVAYQQAQAAAAATVANDANGGFPEPGSYVDPLTNAAACARDIPNLVALGVNTIRVYNLNPTGDHSSCMNAFNAAGIYLIADLALPLNGSINRADPSWDISLLNAYLTTLDSITQYPNLLAVNVGNEIVTSTANSGAGPFIKAAVRDVKSYLAAKNSKVLVGYSSVDGGPFVSQLAAYLSCGSAATSIDIFGLNSYSWCGADTYTSSGDAANTARFAKYNIPAYFSEFGCITGSRTWMEVGALFSAPMSNVWSGGLAFAYFADPLGYGLTNNLTSPNDPITTNAQFALLAAQYRATTPPASTNATTAATVYPACAPEDANLIASAVIPPTPSYAVCNCLARNAYGCANLPATPVVVGSLLDQACALFSRVGGSCAAIAGNGTSGVYGSVSSCSAETKLAYVASSYYAQQSFNAQACSFGGNLTVNPLAPKTVTGFTAAEAKCVSDGPTGTFTPTLPVGVVVAAGSTSRANSSSTGSAPAASSTGASGRSAGERSGVHLAASMLAVAVGVGMGSLVL